MAPNLTFPTHLFVFYDLALTTDLGGVYRDITNQGVSRVGMATTGGRKPTQIEGQYGNVPLWSATNLALFWGQDQG